MAFAEDEQRPKPRERHVLGGELAKLSADELRALAGELRNEVGRVEAELASRGATRSAAESLFRRS